MGLPYSKFFWSDYMRDTRMLSLEAKGAWMDILCHLSATPSVGEASYKIDSWARLLGCSKATCKKVFDELIECGVGEILEKNGKFFVKNSRIVRDFYDYCQNQKACSDAGKKSAKNRRNPHEINKTTSTTVEHPLNDRCNEKPTTVEHPLNEPTNEKATISESRIQKPLRSSERVPRAHEEAAIPTLDEVKEYANRIGATEATAIKFFKHYNGNNTWLNQFNRLIKWRDKLADWKLEDQKIKSNGKGIGNKQVVDRNIGTANEGAASEYAGRGILE